MKINNIHCLALNYKGVGEVNQDPIYFLKSTSCLTYEGNEIKKYNVNCANFYQLSFMPKFYK